MADTRRKDNFANKRKYRDKQKRKIPKKDNLVDVWTDTLGRSKRYFSKGVYSQKITTDFTIGSTVPGDAPPEIIVEDEDTFNMAVRYTSSHRVLVLNMASDFKPGGSVRTGGTAQEEELFRRSNACMSHLELDYPLAVNEAIYSPDLVIFKDQTYAYIEPEYFGMISCPALRKPKLVNGAYTPEQREIMKQKIELIFKVGVEGRYNCLVLGALGCGVFQNPPEEVASMFKQMIQKYGNYFKIITFAILDVGASGKSNLDTFKRILM